jgi:Asp-tRNA(Asn)/Glu-tRNA(Gln) amidotransferase A subunit family amidase
MAELTDLTVIQALTALQSGTCSSQELTHACLARIDAL